MTAKDKYYIRVKNTLVEVTHEVYLVFYRFGRQERNQQEKEKRNHVISYDAWDTGERTGQELLPCLMRPMWRNSLSQPSCQSNCIGACGCFRKRSVS